MTVIKTTNGYVFGGFTEQAWHSNGGWIKDPNAFIFSLINKDKKPFRVMCSNEGEEAIFCYSLRGPSFGGDGTYETDISIEDDSDVNRHSYSDFGHSYKHSDYPEKANKANTVLAGSNYFKTVEIEVFAKEYWSPVFLSNCIIVLVLVL